MHYTFAVSNLLNYLNMKLLTTLLLVFFVSFTFAQDKNTIDTKELNIETTNNVLQIEKKVVISVKGIKTMDEIDIENYNKSLYLKLIAFKKQKPKMC